MVLQIRRITALTPNVGRISGVTLMIELNQRTFKREQLLNVEKIGNDFSVIYCHDTLNEFPDPTQPPAFQDPNERAYYGLLLLDENTDITSTNSTSIIGLGYIGTFTVSGQPKHVVFI